VDINLLSHPLLKELVRTHGLQLSDINVESPDGGASIRHSIEKVGDAFRLVVDHSHFTAKRTEFALKNNDDGTAARIVQAVQDTVIGLQAKTLEMLASVNGAVINSLDENEIVHNVLREVMHVLPHSDAGVFRLFDEASGFLVPVSHVGLPKDYSDYRVQPNESVSGEVFATGRPAIHNGRQNIIDAHRVMRPESQSFMERSEIANALLCVPVMAEGKRLGTLTTLRFSNDGAFSIFDRTVLEFLAAQIAIAYQRSLTYRNAVGTAHRLEQMRSDLARKNAELDRAVELHEALLRIFSAGNGLPEQLRAVAELFHVDFRFMNVLGLDYRSAGWADDEPFVMQIVEVAEAPVGQFYVPISGDAGYHRVLFGTLATFVALDFVRDMSRMDVLNARRKAHFEALIAGLGLDRRYSHHDGFRLERYSQIFVARTPQRTVSDNTRLSLHKSQSDLQKGMTLSNSLIFHSEDQIVALVSASTTAALERNLSAVSDAAMKFSICIGASEIYGESERHLASRDLAAQAAGALSRRGRSGLLRYRDMGVELLLEGRARRDILEFTRNILTPLLHDPKHRVLHDTLSRYIHEGKSVARTAQALNIHPNTLYQRLQRVEALTGRKIADAADFTLLSLACQLYAEYSREATD
jgi:hypothetical protein